MISPSQLLALALIPLIHYIADFECQTNWLAVNKSKRLDALALHVGIYSLCFALVFGWQFGLITFATHFVTDFLTSRWTSRLWFIDTYPREDCRPDYYGAYPLYARFKESRHRFFCAIGFDQMVHAYTLFGTALWLGTKVIWL
jgi:hypothetical protein